MERLQEIKITITVGTNKDTYTKTFDNIKDATDWYAEILESING